MRIKSFIALAAIVLTLQGCGKMYPMFHGAAPSSVKVERLDMTGAAALAVMPYAGATKAATKADGEEYEDRLYIVDKDGKTKLASFTITDDGSKNVIWKKIRETLTLVPDDIFHLTDDLIMLAGVDPVYDYNWSSEAWGWEESEAISSTLNKLSGGYFLRISDGALFKSPFDLKLEKTEFKASSSMTVGQIIKFTRDKKQMVVCPNESTLKYKGMNFQITEDLWRNDISPDSLFPWVLTDKGNSFELKMPSESLLNMWGSGCFLLTANDRIIPVVQGKGGWSFDMDLKPLYIDYTQELQDVLSNKSWYERYVFDFNGETYIVTPYLDSVYKLFMNGNKLDCSLVCSRDREDNDWNYSLDAGNYSAASTNSSILFMFNGAKASVDIIRKTIVIEEFPADFPKDWRLYDDTGLAYEMTDDVIYSYNLNTKEKKAVSIHWEQVDFGGFATYTAEYSNGVFSVSGRTRTATSVTVLVDVETGNVTLTGLSEYSGPVVKTYYRLN